MVFLFFSKGEADPPAAELLPQGCCGGSGLLEQHRQGDLRGGAEILGRSTKRADAISVSARPKHTPGTQTCGLIFRVRAFPGQH